MKEEKITVGENERRKVDSVSMEKRREGRIESKKKVRSLRRKGKRFKICRVVMAQNQQGVNGT